MSKVFTNDLQSPEFKHRFNKFDLLFLIGAAIFLYATLFQLPFTPFFYEGDHQIFLLDGWRMHDDEIIYRDFFQFTYPGTSVLYYFLFNLFGLHFSILNWVILAIGLGGTYFCLEISRRLSNYRLLVYLPPILYLFFGFRWFGIDGSHRMLSPLAIAAAVWLLLDKCTLLRLAGAGAMCAVASFFTQQRGVVAVGALTIFVLYEGWTTRQNWRRLLLAAFCLNSAFSVTLGGLCAYFIIAAGFDNFYQSTFVFLQYYRYDSFNNYSSFLQELSPLTRSQNFLALAVHCFHYFITPLSLIVFFTLFAFKKSDADWRFWRKPLLVAMVSGFLTLATLGAPLAGRLYQVSIFGLILFGWLLDRFFRRQKTFKAAIYASYAVLIVLSVATVVRNQTYSTLTVFDAPTGRSVFLTSDAAARYLWLKERTAPGDFVFETYQPTVNFPLLLRNPTRISHLRDTAYTRPEQITDAVAKLKANPPKFILWNKNWSKPQSVRAADDSLGLLYDYLLESYQPVEPTYEHFGLVIEIWERKH